MTTKITIADLFPHDEGMILVAKDGVDGSLRHISEVSNGLACGCKCFGCDRQLIARNGGEVRAHSFAHRPEDMVYDCTTAGETALHIRAKEIIAQHRRVTLPATSVVGLDGNTIEVTPERSVELTDVRLEMVAGELIPDVTATMPDGRRIFIEIANTHLCPPSKIDKLDAMGVEVLEIMVSAYRAVPLDELDDIILDLAPRKLIHSSEVKAMEAKIAADRQRHEDNKRAEAQRLVDIYREGDPGNHKQAQKLVDAMVRRGLSAHIDIDDNRPSAFIVYRRQWQAAIFDRLYQADNNQPTSAFDIAKSWSDRWAKPGLRNVKSEHSRWIAREMADDFKSPYEEIAAYLARLQAAEVVYKTSRGNAYYMHYRFKEDLRAAIEKESLPAKRKSQILEAVKAIADLMQPSDGRIEHFDEWLKGCAVRYGMRDQTLLSNEGAEFNDLMTRLRKIPAAVAAIQRSHRNDLPEDMVGLDLTGMYQRLRIERDLARERAEAERAARLEQEAVATAERLAREAADRVSKIEEQAILVVADVDAFLGTPLPGHDGRTSRELAAESLNGYMAVQRELDRIRDADRATAEAERQHKEMVGKLWDRVNSRIPDRARAALWPLQKWPELGGMKPIEFCKDKKSLERCFEVLEQWVKAEQKRGRR
ncbi:hypothetical protein [Agrobacterium tumefaciens]|uniref:DUF2384 domain-containing protein n=1 Tax=Agrobacterium tumefaciens TaxID=358 RepID=A0A176XJ77_AGRTU|nr:hypothetical protein [Agrobacterium tumefaciens]OAE49176.1 hypothetical protein A7J57_00740 [Agrobacterium tumefaciens]